MAIDMCSNNPVGFRFHPTDAELVSGYLKPKILGRPFADVISEIDLCQSEPWELPQKSKIKSKDRVWWFLCRRDYKSPSSKRLKRTTMTGFWKITGQERMIKDEDTKQCLGRKRTLVFYSGIAPGKRTNWVMQEIYLDPSTFSSTLHQMDAYVVCKLKRKSDENAETPEGEIQQMVSQVNSSRESSVSEEENCGVITQEDINQLLDDEPDYIEESPEDKFANSFLCDPDDGNFSDDPFIAQSPSKRPYFSDAPGGGTDTDAEGTNGLYNCLKQQLQSSGSFDSSISGSKRVRHLSMSNTSSLKLQACVDDDPHFTQLHSDVACEVEPTHITAIGGGTRPKRVQFQSTPTSDKAKHVTGKEVRAGEAGGDAKSAESCKSSVDARKSWSFFESVDSSSLSICDLRSPYEYCLNLLVGTVLFAVFVRELVVFGGW